MKKILIIINNLGIGGAERMVVNEINEMLNRDIDVHLLTLKPEKNKSFADDCLIEVDKWKLIHFGSLCNVLSWLRVLVFIKKVKPDVIISHLWFANTIAKIISKILNLKLLSFEQNVYDGLKSWKMFFVDKILQNFSFKTIAVSKTVKKSLLNHGIKKEKIEIIYNSVDVKKYQNINKDKYLLKDQKFKFLYIGRLIKQKGLDTLIKAFKNVADAHLYLVGEGDEKEMLRDLIEKENLQERVFLLGLKLNTSEILAVADCFVYPSRYDGFSLVLLEALASSKPVIVSDFSSNIEIVEDMKDGLVFNVDNVEELTDKMNQIKNNLILRDKLAIAAKKKADDFSIESHVNKILEYAK